MTDQNKDSPNLITPEAEQRLSEMDKQLEEMLRENEALFNQQEDREPPINPSEVLENANTRKRVQSHKEEINQIYELSQEELKDLYDSMMEGEDNTVSELLKLLASSISFTGGMQKFLDVVVNQLKLGDIDLKKEKFDPIMQQFLDLKVLMLLINTITKGEYKEDLKETETTIYNKLVFGYFNLNTKERDTTSESIMSLQKTLSNNIKDLSFEVSKNASKQQEGHTNFLKKLDETFKRTVNKIEKTK